MAPRILLVLIVLSGLVSACGISTKMTVDQVDCASSKVTIEREGDIEGK